ncbi:hypothetical protein BDV06DRAFT_227152 [Aspergillus oleicola]
MPCPGEPRDSDIGHGVLRQGDMAFSEIKQDTDYSKTENLGAAFSRLGGLYLHAYRLLEAELMFSLARDNRALNNGAEASGTIQMHYAFGEVYVRQRRFPFHNLSVFNALGLAYLFQEKLHEAKMTLYEAVAGRETFLGSGHWTALQSMYYLALVPEKQGSLQAAEPILQSVIDFNPRDNAQVNPRILWQAQARLENIRDVLDHTNAAGPVEEEIDLASLRIDNREPRL